MFKNKIMYEIDVDAKIVYLYFAGEIASSNIIKTHTQAINDEKYNKDFNWIIDFRKGKQLFNKIKSFIDFFKKKSEYFQHVKMAFILGSPKQIAEFNNLVNQFESNNISIIAKKVSSKKAAYEWILSKD